MEYANADAMFCGVEAHADVTLTESLGAELTWDFVRAERTSDGEPLPRIPPQRLVAGLRYTNGPFQVGGNVTAAGAPGSRVRQRDADRRLRACCAFYASYSLQSDRALQTITARLDNATDTLYRNHLNFLKDVVPEMGRAFRLVYSVKF